MVVDLFIRLIMKNMIYLFVSIYMEKRMDGVIYIQNNIPIVLLILRQECM